jgi:hypothetical protein
MFMKDFGAIFRPLILLVHVNTVKVLCLHHYFAWQSGTFWPDMSATELLVS